MKGAFTGAVANRVGAAAMADGGTLFLDEICDMAPDLQAKLLRFVQTGLFQPVGSSEPLTVDVRFVCATNRDPPAEIEAGRFRADLYYRLHVIPIHLPPLRQREEDVIEIAEHLLSGISRAEERSFRGFDADARAHLREYSWPGNVRELENVVRNVVVLNDGGIATADMLPVGMNADMLPVPANDPVKIRTSEGTTRPLHDIERDAIQAALDACDGHVPRAAALLQISPSTIYRKMQGWGEDSAVS